MKIYALTTPITKSFNKITNSINNSRLAFKGQLDHDEFASQQKNDPDISLDPEIYISKMVDKAFEKVGFDSTKIPKVDEIDEENIMYMSASTMIDSLKLVANMQFEEIPKEMLSKIPTFFTTNIDKYIEIYSKLNESVALTNDAIQEQLILTDGDSEDAEALSFVASIMDSLTKEMPDYSLIGKYLKENKYEELKEIFKKIDTIANYQKIKAIEAGFERNPKRVIDILSNSSFIASKPVIEDNEDGTSTYKYAYFTNILQVRRNNLNGDYISFSMGLNQDITGEFNKDGTIRQLAFKNQYDNSTTIIIPMSATKTITTINESDSYKVIREFKVQNDKSYKLIDFKLLQK